MARPRPPLPPDRFIIDGGLSTQLERQGCDVHGHLWTAHALLDQPAEVEAAHRAFVDAGADIIISASYQVSRQGFAELGRDEHDADDALRASIQVARSATEGTAALVAASVGPYGAVLHDGSEYRGRYGLTHRRLVDFHRARLDVLVSAGPDLLAVETIPDADEASALAEVLDDYPDIPAWMTFSAPDDAHVWSGHSIEDAASAVTGSVSAVGINCTDPSHVEGLLTRLGAVTSLPLVAYPNVGGSWDAASGEWSTGLGDEDAMWSPMQRWRARGAQYIGGCCGTDARSIRRLAASLR